MSKGTMPRILPLVLLAATLAACVVPGPKASGELKVDRDQAGTPAEFTITPITPAFLASAGQVGATARSNPDLEQAIKRYEYRVGPQDVLTFIVWDHPELTIPAGEYRSPDQAGHKVGNDGMLFFPYVGEISVVGKTLREIRIDLTQRLEKYIARPQLDVRVAAFRSQKVVITGEVETPGILPISDVPLTLAQAINVAEGALESADLTSVMLVRDGKAQAFDIQALLDKGDMQQNVLLRDGDIVTVPDSNMNRVHVLGEVNKPGSVKMYRGKLTLADAIGLSESFNSNTSDPGRIFVVRGAPDKPLVYWLDGRSPESMLLAARFPLQAQDVVYVSHTSLAGWNRVMSQLLPTINALYQLTILNREFTDSN